MRGDCSCAVAAILSARPVATQKGPALAQGSSPPPEVALSLALAVVAASTTPLLLLDGDLRVLAASSSFLTAFNIEADAIGESFFAMGGGEWNSPRLRSLLKSTIDASVEIDAYDYELERPRRQTRNLVLNAHLLAHDHPGDIRLLLAIADNTEARAAAQLNADLLREKSVLLQEIQHRVANSLQIIASVLLQSARKVQSEETRGHLHDAHNRVMSIAAVQQQLAQSHIGEVALRPYFSKLCSSLGASMIGSDERVEIAVTADDTHVTANTSVSLGLIVTELVINALKHAFPGQRGGRILVAYQTQDADWTLSVRDDGVGMPPKGKAAAKAGLGTSIVEALARQLQAHIVVKDAKPGTLVSVIHTLSAANDPEAMPTVTAV